MITLKKIFSVVEEICATTDATSAEILRSAPYYRWFNLASKGVFKNVTSIPLWMQRKSASFLNFPCTPNDLCTKIPCGFVRFCWPAARAFFSLFDPKTDGSIYEMSFNLDADES